MLLGVGIPTNGYIDSLIPHSETWSLVGISVDTCKYISPSMIETADKRERVIRYSEGKRELSI